ncbi:MAG TPA: hypothetical protein H9867_09455 [Candidatus Corynebacterium gallistercoris]|uniref:Secreted protein n=1 Tax=Candidatus Corynebacterium gallistercoris TaxID=2838530 RepID=A0A9D1RZJ1_9CORY|nr:hypothetical protein [Candidatus Corynebacterium gallistercoris]
MAITRRTSRAVAAITAACALAVPTVVEPAPASAQIQGSIDHLGRPAPHVLAQIEAFAENPALPENVRSSLKRLVAFFRGDGEPGVEVPKNGPAFTQFGWPTVAGNCIGGKNNAVGTAMAVPGPAALPLPGIGEGQVNFVFTALGTGTAHPKPQNAMNVHWININTGKMGRTPLHYTGINPEGPTTVNGVGDTGRGTVIALLEGGVTTDEGDAGVGVCNFLPTAALIQV